MAGIEPKALSFHPQLATGKTLSPAKEAIIVLCET
jgi:hypothetical protein